MAVNDRFAPSRWATLFEECGNSNSVKNFLRKNTPVMLDAHLNLAPLVVVRLLPAEDGERAEGPLRGVQLHDGLEALRRVRVHGDPVLLKQAGSCSTLLTR